MKRRFGLLGVAALGLLALLALACTTTKTTVLPQSAQTGITVGGEGSVYGTPDVAEVSLGVEATASSVGDARSKAAASMDAMLKALKDGGVADKDIQTTQFSVQPQYDYTANKQTIIGFSVSNIVVVKIHDIDKTGELVDAAVTAGGDQARVQSLQFTIDDPTSLKNQAREKAMADAKSRAETLAKAAGVTLGAPISISESGGATPIFYDGDRSGAFLEQAAANTPIETGQLQVQIQVSVVYELKK